MLYLFFFFPTGPETNPLSIGPGKNRPDTWPGFIVGLRGRGWSRREANLLVLSKPEANNDASVEGEAVRAVEVLALTEAPEIERKETAVPL